jgi:hypothetical protein
VNAKIPGRTRRSIENAAYKRAADLAKFHARQCEGAARKADGDFWNRIEAAHWRIIERGIRDRDFPKYPEPDPRTCRSIEKRAYERAASLAKYHIRYWESEVRTGKRDDRFWNKARAAHWRIIIKAIRNLAKIPGTRR